MITTNRSAKLVAITLVVAAALIWAALPAQQVNAIQDSEDFPVPFGLTSGQAARLTLLNIGETAIVGPEYRFLTGTGAVLAQSTGTIEIPPGEFRTYDFPFPEPTGGTVYLYGRVQVRAAVTSIGNPDIKNLLVSVEVFDTATGRTSFILQPPPEPESHE